MDDYNSVPRDKEKFCKALQEAWELLPEKNLLDLLDILFQGQTVTELTEDEQYGLMNEFIHANM